MRPDVIINLLIGFGPGTAAAMPFWPFLLGLIRDYEQKKLEAKKRAADLLEARKEKARLAAEEAASPYRVYGDTLTFRCEICGRINYWGLPFVNMIFAQLPED